MTKEERRIIAEKHNQYMIDNFLEDTNKSFEKSIVYDKHIQNIEVIDCTTEDAVFAYDNCTVLNFASFTRPGGGFIKGSIAQEEAICHASNLYNVLEKFTNLYNKNYNDKSRYNDGLYTDWAIYSPNIVFIKNNKTTHANVITCAAPNYNSYTEHTAYDTTNRYEKAVMSRIKYILSIASANNTKTLILGAFGCGVFGNYPEFIANCFKKALKDYIFDKVVFAIPAGNNKNFDQFYKVFKNYLN